MRLLTFTTLYPNLNRPSHGIFVETRRAQLVASGQVTARVMAPVPYVPDLTFLPDHYRRFCGVPEREERGGIVVDHPRYFLLPKLSMLAAPVSLYLAARRQLSALLRDGYEFDIIDAHYFYPDGVAAVLLGRYFGKPVIVTARGSDINVLAQYRLPRRMIRWAAAKADGIIAVSRALEQSLLALGAPADKIRVLRNGVDLRAFRPGDRAAARARFGVDGPLLLSVGNLVPLKGHDIAIQALMSLPGIHLAIVGDGPEEVRLRALAERYGVSQRVRFLGRLPQTALPELYVAADVLLLLSSSEGWPNVLLEAMACGTPAIGTRVGGIPEIIATPAAGELVDQRTPTAVVEAVNRLLARQWDRAAVRAYAEGFSWDATTRGQLDLFTEILALRRRPTRVDGMARDPPPTPS